MKVIMNDFKVVLPQTTEEWQRDMNIAYNQALEDLIEYYKTNYEEMKRIENGREPFVYVKNLIQKLECSKR